MKQPRASILVVDDDASLCDLLVDTLEAVGYRTTGASDGIEALQRLKQEKFDLMISDIKMPGVDGIALLKKVRRYYPDLPVLLITGVASPEVIVRASPDGFLAKPFRISLIEELIEDTLNGKPVHSARPIRRVLVVDDDDLFREMLSEVLRYNDYIPYAVPSGEEALQELENGAVDAVIADIKMPGMDGISLLKKVKGKYPRMPVILITAFFSRGETDCKVGSIEPDGFLHKPFEADNILKILKEISLTPASQQS